MELIRIRCRDRGGPVIVTAESGEKVVKLAVVDPVKASEVTFSMEEIRMHLTDATPVAVACENNHADDEDA